MDSMGTVITGLYRRSYSRRTMMKLVGGTISIPVVSTLIAACGGSKTGSTATTSSGQVAATSVAGQPTPLDTFKNAGTPTAASQ